MTIQSMIGAALITVISALFGTGYYLYITLTPMPLVPACDPGTVPISTVLLIDRTDPFTDTQQARVERLLSEVPRSLQAGARFSVYTVEMGADPTLIWSGCILRDGRDANEWTEGRKRLAIAYKKYVEAPIADVTKRLGEPAQAQQSPLFEAIAKVVEAPGFSSDISNRTLILFSDMLHNTADFSQYRNRISYEAFRTTPYAQRVKARLDGLATTIFYLQNPKARGYQNEAHIVFWQAWLEDMGAVATVEVVP